MTAAPVGAEVWVLDLTIVGPESGDYDGGRSLHASREGAFAKLLGKVAKYGVDFGDDVETLASVASENGSMCGDFAIDELTVSYGVQSTTVEP